MVRCHILSISRLSNSKKNENKKGNRQLSDSLCSITTTAKNYLGPVYVQFSVIVNLPKTVYLITNDLSSGLLIVN